MIGAGVGGRESGSTLRAHRGVKDVVRGGTGRLDWRFVILAALYGFVVLEALYFTFRPGGLFAFGLGYDQHTYLGAARDWLAGRGFYESYQLAGPYRIQAAEILYPPSLLVVLVPFTFLPEPAFVLVPLAVTAAVVWSWHPSYRGWLLIGACLAAPSSFGLYLFGNPGMWAVAAVALATRYGVGPLVLVKPTFAPFALVGIRTRAWWLTLAAGLGFAFLTLPLWLDYLTVMRNIIEPDPFYAVWTVPMMLVPLIAARSSRRDRAELLDHEQDEGVAVSRGGVCERERRSRSHQPRGTEAVYTRLGRDE
jgi:hypothetical protein